MVGGPSSPLIIIVEYKTPEKTEEQSYNVFPVQGKATGWQWKK
ncbi:MAG: hypothetical protein ACI86H_002109 [bacterium]|jgi:hypothetical protein